MERCSYFIQDKALFGSFPSQEDVHLLESEGVKFFIDLTDIGEHKTMPYRTKNTYIKYPIKDRKIPTDWVSFSKLIIQIVNIIKNLGNHEKIYIHCKGGHGRSGILVSCILCYYYKIEPEKALKLTSNFHSNRKIMKEKWRIMGSPQGKRQKEFVLRFFNKIKFIKPEIFGNTVGMHNISSHSVTIEEVGTFDNAQAAFEYFKSNYSSETITEEIKTQWMYTVLKNKFLQHVELRENLIKTCLRPIVKCSIDTFWGDGWNGQGKNIHGKLLEKIREEFLV